MRRINEFKATRYITSEAVRKVCIRCKYYTFGDNEEYSNLLDMVKDENGNHKELNDELLADLTEDIFNHSNIEKFKLIFGCTDEELIASMAFNLVDASYYDIAVGLEE